MVEVAGGAGGGVVVVAATAAVGVGKSDKNTNVLVVARTMAESNHSN